METGVCEPACRRGSDLLSGPGDALCAAGKHRAADFQEGESKSEGNPGGARSEGASPWVSGGGAGCTSESKGRRLVN